MHYTTRRFWQCYNELPENVQHTADECYQLLKDDPSHPSLRFKKLGKKYWSVRAGLSYRALGVEVKGGISWFWIGTMLGNLNTVHCCQGLISRIRKRVKVYDFRGFTK